LFYIRGKKKAFKVIFQEKLATRKLKIFEGRRIVKIEGI